MKKLTFTLLLCASLNITAAPLPDDVAAALQTLQKYEYGQPRLPLFTLEAFSGRATAKPEQQQALAAAYLKVLTAGDSTAAARIFACQQLALVGGAAEVPALAVLLNQPEQTDFARLALQAIPAPEAGAALRTALATLTGKPLIGVINSLGERRDEPSVPALSKLSKQSDDAVRAAACLALGKIGTAEAAVALPADAVEARLLCAERAGGITAQDIYTALSTAAQPALRLAGLTGLVRLDAARATPLLTKAIHDADSALALGALRVLGQLNGDAATTALVAELPKLDATRQVALLVILAERRTTSARGAVTALAGNGDEAVRVAALEALGTLGDASSLPTLLLAAAEKKGAVKAAAETALVQLAAPGADEAFVKAIASGAAGERIAAINAAAIRAQTRALPPLCAALRDSDESVRAAAARAVGKFGTPDIYPQLVALLGAAQDTEVESAIAAVGRRMSDAHARLTPLLALLKLEGTKVATQAAVLRTLAGIGGDDALAAVRERLTSNDAALHEAAVRALCDWSDGAALEALKGLVLTSANGTHKALAMRGLFRLAPTVKNGACWFGDTFAAMQTADEKRQWLGALGTVHEADALIAAEGLLKDPDVKHEAALAMAHIGKTLVAAEPARILEYMNAVLAAVPTSTEAKAVRAEAQQALGIKSAHSSARRQTLAAGLPAAAKIVAYLDCGVEQQDKAKDGVTLRALSGQNWTWHGQSENPAALTAVFAGGRLKFEASGLQPQKHYQLGFTWWDYDANGREQSVWVGGKQVLAKTALPAWQGKQQGPLQLAVAIPSDAIKNGKVAIEFRGEGQSNVVCSEIWLVAASVPFATVTATATLTVLPAPPPAARVTQPEVRANAGAPKKILIVTGCDYPGHKWQLTTPVLTAALAKDKRLEISVIEDASFLGAPELKKYDGLVLHYQNHQIPAPGPEALANFRQFVEEGRGLVLVHFSCGAFYDWTTKTVSKDFLPLAGRVWDSKLRGHDPRGPFRVQVTDHAHPITAGLADFETTDELYTCLSGDVPIQVLATATSKVDKKIYPMAFTLTPGKGRTFHSVLGHDAQALGESVGTLYRRATAWAAGLPLDD
jgi:HEAT repeat protein/type 1 glutamine amidotransferase